MTARGLEDLSRILLEYEDLEIPVDEELMRQYLQCESIAHEFFGWYELYRSYGADFSALRLEEREPDEALFVRARAAGWEERCCLVQYGARKRPRPGLRRKKGIVCSGNGRSF